MLMLTGKAVPWWPVKALVELGMLDVNIGYFEVRADLYMYSGHVRTVSHGHARQRRMHDCAQCRCAFFT